GYLVTFKKIDPFFVVDLSDPANPEILGQLKIPGFSDYLHPFGPNHVIGVGKDAYDMGDFAWFQGVKLSLFDVSDPMDPQEVASVVIGDRGTESEVLSEHKAFLLIPGRDLLVLPITLAETSGGEPSEYGRQVWQGAFVYAVSTEGFVEKARISHGGIVGEMPYPTLFVRRSFHVEDVLYTVSEDLLRMNDLDTYAGLGDVSL
ncbi:MAG: beta-propeller domain-containing protein, partial [Candidatus Thermoplasmatota archaeon]